MATWPTIEEPTHIFRRTHKAQLKASFEAGYVQSAARDTRARLIVEMEWEVLPGSDLATLEMFFADNQGGTFTWTDPTTETSHTMRFAGDTIEADHVDGMDDHWHVRIDIEEQ